MNQVIISGRLTKDVELKYTASQMAVASFSIALDRGKDKDGNSKGTDYPNCKAFGKTAENLERFSGKGLRVLLQGRLQTGSYEGKNGKVYTTDVIADRIEIIDFKGSNQQQSKPKSEPYAPEGFAELDSDIPF